MIFRQCCKLLHHVLQLLLSPIFELGSVATHSFMSGWRMFHLLNSPSNRGQFENVHLKYNWWTAERNQKIFSWESIGLFKAAWKKCYFSPHSPNCYFLENSRTATGHCNFRMSLKSRKNWTFNSYDGICSKAWFPLSQLRPRQRPISSQNEAISVNDDCPTL